MKYLTLFAISAFAVGLSLGCVPNSPSLPNNTTTPVESGAEVTSASPADATTKPLANDDETLAQAQPITPVSTTNQQEPERITFDDINCNIQANLVFRDWMLTPRAKELDGQRVRLAGYMLADLKIDGIEEFVLLKNTECKFGPDGQADHLALIKMTGDETANFTDKPIDVIGTLHYKPFQGIDGFTWAIYEIEAEAIRPMRR